MQRITRKAAKAASLKYYFTGKPCKRGHTDKRFVSSFWCMTCVREKAREIYRNLSGEHKQRLLEANRKRSRQWNEAHRDEQRPKFAKYRAARKETHPDYFRQHYAKNKDCKKQKSQEWYRANSGYALERQKAYAAKRLAESPELVRAIGRQNRSKRRAILERAFIENVDPRVVFERDKGMCGICLLTVDPASKWEVDHVIAISRGGVHSYANVQLSHRRCNRSKAAH